MMLIKPAILMLSLVIVFCSSSLNAAELERIENPKIVRDVNRKPVGAIVFIHGLFGDPEATFKGNNGTWVQLMMDDNVPLMRTNANVEVFLRDYDFWSVKYSQLNNLNMLDHAKALKRALTNYNELAGYSHVIIIAHSLGGLLTMKFLSDPEQKASVAKVHVAGALLFAVPIGGLDEPSGFVDKILLWGAKQFSPNTLRDLETGADNSFLQGISDNWKLFRENPQRRTKLFCAYEKQPTVGMSKPWVPYERALRDCDGEVPPWELDHLSIVKPNSYKDDLYKWTKMNIGNILADAQADVETSSVTKLMPSAAAPGAQREAYTTTVPVSRETKSPESGVIGSVGAAATHNTEPSADVEVPTNANAQNQKGRESAQTDEVLEIKKFLERRGYSILRDSKESVKGPLAAVVGPDTSRAITKVQRKINSLRIQCDPALPNLALDGKPSAGLLLALRKIDGAYTRRVRENCASKDTANAMAASEKTKSAKPHRDAKKPVTAVSKPARQRTISVSTLETQVVRLGKLVDTFKEGLSSDIFRRASGNESPELKVELRPDVASEKLSCKHDECERFVVQGAIKLSVSGDVWKGGTPNFSKNYSVELVCHVTSLSTFAQQASADRCRIDDADLNEIASAMANDVNSIASVR